MADPKAVYLRFHQELVCIVVTALVAGLAALFAFLFRQVVLAGVKFVTGYDHRIQGVWHWSALRIGICIAISLLVAIAIGSLSTRWFGRRIGLHATAEAAAGLGPGPSVRATLLRSSGTLIASVSMTSLGRESAILETGGAIGFAAGRRLWGRAPAIAAAGVAAAFASAYHAPFAAVIYVERHLRVRGRFPAGYYTVAGAAVGFTITQAFLGGEPLLPASTGSLPDMAVLAIIAAPAAFVGSWLFAELRDGTWVGPSRFSLRQYPRFSVALMIVLAAAVVAFVPLSGGNGLEGLRVAATQTTLGVGAALGLAKLVATVASVRSGAPGGVFSPSLAVAAGWALMAFAVLGELGIELPGQRWDGALVAMSIGIVVSLRMPVLAGVVVAEMTGDLRLLPVTGMAALFAAMALKRIDRKRGAGRYAEPQLLGDHDG